MPNSPRFEHSRGEGGSYFFSIADSVHIPRPLNTLSHTPALPSNPVRTRETHAKRSSRHRANRPPEVDEPRDPKFVPSRAPLPELYSQQSGALLDCCNFPADERREGSMIQLTVNGKAARFDGDPEMPLLWFLRDVLQLTGTKFGCGMACAAPARCMSTARRVRSCHDADEGGRRQERSPPSKGWPPTATIRCRRPGKRATCRSAATARAARSCRPRRC